ncbi:SubName: Full=Uncharacterized protein {ECO:0000313/EMBL:CCA67233.1} [Serendipita indica DSM 11827]|nr:SubName: Full=Uncharacterized protein {ECO:0000313/EMBL:CCA67233.1} [Serendipita indica DSM 11827]
MTLFNSLLSAALLAVSVLTAQADATPLVANGLSARHPHVGMSANHHGQLRKRVSHRHRAVCGDKKLGLAAEWNVDASRLVSPRTCITYNWDASNRGPYDIPGLIYVPMVSRLGNLDGFYANVVNRPDRNYPWIAFLNEANEPGQANVDVGTAVALWRQHALPLRNRGIKLLSPSVTSSPEGTRWIVDFYNSLGDWEKPDAISLHWYGTDFDSLRNYINDMSGRFGGRHIWLTEFGCTLFPYVPCSIDQGSFAAQAIAFLNSHWAIDIYAPFGFVNDLGGANEGVRLIDPGSGNANSLGSMYLWS